MNQIVSRGEKEKISIWKKAAFHATLKHLETVGISQGRRGKPESRQKSAEIEICPRKTQR
jgi:hypothetical protein